ncbi:hypothetical protein GCM10010359_28020 [Streptomyces morookaense]|nr:hypothetical protein GCM10010359_28020 [Streptomyces morookaense]
MPREESRAEAAQFRLPPVAVFWNADPALGTPEFGAEVQAMAARLASALAEVPVYQGIAARDAGLAKAEAAADALVRRLSADVRAPDGDRLAAASPVEEYFRTRMAALSAPQAALQAVLVVHRGVTDLRSAPLAGSDLEYELTAMRQALVDLTGCTSTAAAEPSCADRQSDHPPSTSAPQAMWLARWITGHHIHALFNVCATSVLRKALSHVRAGAVREAVDHLRRTVVYVRGVPASRAHAAAMPADFYCEIVRPTMTPPIVSLPLSGRMHVGFLAWRDALEELLLVLPDPVDELARRAPELAFAREELLEADLVEAERHVCLAESAVAGARSLIQPPRSTENAVAVLRLMRHKRAARYAPFVRFGDQVAAAARKALTGS